MSNNQIIKNKNIVYLLKTKDNKMFKIGKTDRVDTNRIENLNSVWNFDLEESYLVFCNKNKELERTLHYLFNNHNVKGLKGDGSTEFFDMECFDEVKQVVETFSEFDFEDIEMVKYNEIKNINIKEKDNISKEERKQLEVERKQLLNTNNNLTYLKIKTEEHNIKIISSERYMFELASNIKHYVFVKIIDSIIEKDLINKNEEELEELLKYKSDNLISVLSIFNNNLPKRKIKDLFSKYYSFKSDNPNYLFFNYTLLTLQTHGFEYVVDIFKGFYGSKSIIETNFPLVMSYYLYNNDYEKFFKMFNKTQQLIDYLSYKVRDCLKDSKKNINGLIDYICDNNIKLNTEEESFIYELIKSDLFYERNTMNLIERTFKLFNGKQYGISLLLLSEYTNRFEKDKRFIDVLINYKELSKKVDISKNTKTTCHIKENLEDYKEYIGSQKYLYLKDEITLSEITNIEKGKAEQYYIDNNKEKYELLLKVVKNNKEYSCLPEEYKKSYRLCLWLVRKNPSNYYLLDSEMKEFRSIVLESISSDITIYKKLPKELKYDHFILLKIIDKDPSIYMGLPAELKENEELTLKLLKSNQYYLKNCSRKLLKEEMFLAQVACMYPSLMTKMFDFKFISKSLFNSYYLDCIVMINPSNKLMVDKIRKSYKI